MVDLNVVHIITCFIFIVLVIGISHNELGFKYTTAFSSANYSSSSCLKTVLMVNVPKSDICCHESSSSWLCYAVLDKTTKFLTKWPSAIIIPFAPFFLNAAVLSIRTITNCVCLGLTSESCRTHLAALFPTFKRGLFYLGIVLFRMVRYEHFQVSGCLLNYDLYGIAVCPILVPDETSRLALE